MRSCAYTSRYCMCPLVSAHANQMSRVVPPGIWQVESFARCLSLRDLATLSCAEQDWQASVVTLYSSPRARQLVQALEASLPDVAKALAHKELATATILASSCRQLLKHLWTLVATLQASRNAPWGPAIAAAPGLLQDFTQLFMVPGLPYTSPSHFVTHLSLRISYHQLMLAAWNQVAGVEEWVKIQQARGIETDLPDAVVAVCCSEHVFQLDQLLWQTPHEMLDILQLAMNSKHSSTASRIAAHMMPYILDPATLFHLLHTAVARGHHEAVQIAVASPAAAQFTPSAALYLMTEASRSIWFRSGFVLSHLVLLPAAKFIVASDLVPLMQKAADKENESSIQALCTLPAAHDIPTSDLRSMLEQWMGQKPDSAAMQALCSLSAAARLTADDIMPLISKAMTDAGHESIQVLCSLPAAQQMPFSLYNEVLEWAVTQYCRKTVTALCSLPAASQMSAASWVSLMIRVLKSPLHSNAKVLCSMPAAMTLSPEDLTAVIKNALQSERHVSLVALCQLPAAQQLPPGNIPELVRLTEPKPQSIYPWERRQEKSVSDTLQLLASLEPVQRMSAEEFLQVIKHQLQLGYTDAAALQIWYKCPAAHSMPADVLTQHMQEAVEQQDLALLQALCQIPAAGLMIDADMFLQLIDSAVQAHSNASVVQDDNDDADSADEDDKESISMSMLRCISELPARYLLSSNQLADVMSAIVRSNMDLVLQLYDLPAVSLMPVTRVANMLQTAVQHNNRDNVEVLCGMTVASNFSSSLIERLLLIAVDLEDKYSSWHQPPADIVTLLCALPGAAGVTNVGVLLKRALQHAYADRVYELCQLPATRDVTADALAWYLNLAVRLGDDTAVEALCKLRSAGSIQKHVVTQLLQIAVQTGNTSVLPALCQLRAAHRISQDTLLKLLQRTAGLSKYRQDSVLALIKLMRRVSTYRRLFTKSCQSCQSWEP